MKLFDEYHRPITYTKQFWLGNFFGIPAKQSLFNTALSRYLDNQEVVLKVNINDPIADFSRPVLENYSDHSANLYYHDDNPCITLASAFNFKKYNNHEHGGFKVKNIVYFPFWLFFSKYAQQDDVESFTDSRTYLASCLNRNTRGQRMYILNQLSQKSYFKDMFVTVGPIANTDSANFEVTVSAQEVQQFTQLHSTIPKIKMDMMNEYYHCARVYEPGWADSYLNIVTEPRVDDSGFLSEKIFKPLRAEQLFLVQGCPGTIGYLKSIGFDVFDDYIDHSRYDNEPDWQQRTQLMLQVLDDIYPNIETIFAETKQRRINNRLYLQSDTLELALLKDLLECIDLYVPPVL